MARRRWYEILETFSSAIYCRWNARFSERQVVNRRTDLVIEGFQGSANSWLREVFLLTQPGISVASNLHSAAHVRRAVQLGVPTIVLLRAPADAVVSHVSRYPHRMADVRGEFRRYRRFYSGLENVADRVLLVTFEQAVHSVEAVVSAVNKKFGTGFVAVGDRGRGLEEEVFSILDRITGQEFTMMSPRPSDARTSAKVAARAAVESTDRRMVAECEVRYQQLAAHALRSWPPDEGEVDRSVGFS